VASENVSPNLQDSSIEAAGEEACLNHAGKKASYRLLEEQADPSEQRVSVCSRCAVMLARQGFRVKELCDTREQARDSQIRQLCAELDRLAVQLRTRLLNAEYVFQEVEVRFSQRKND
jgi:hypothetical protein